MHQCLPVQVGIETNQHIAEPIPIHIAHKGQLGPHPTIDLIRSPSLQHTAILPAQNDDRVRQGNAHRNLPPPVPVQIIQLQRTFTEAPTLPLAPVFDP